MTASSHVKTNQSRLLDGYLIRIAENALGPDECRHLPPVSVSHKQRQKAHRLLLRWEKLVYTKSGNPKDFDRRLSSLGLDRSSALNKLQIKRSLQNESLPFWAKQLGHILNQAPYPCCKNIQNMLVIAKDKREPLFPEFLHPFIHYYLKKFKDSISSLDESISQEVLKLFAQDLLKHLSFVSARVVSADIKQKSVLGLLTGSTSNERYNYYVNEILGSPQGLLDLLLSYPVLARLLVIITTQAICNSVRFIKRLTVDRVQIAESFFQGTDFGRISSIDFSLSDPHNGGQRVWSVIFESGLRLAYKPRSLCMDVAYTKFLEWFNEIHPNLTLRAAPVLPKKGYGWVLWIESSDCKSQQQVSQFYRRQGAHLAIFYLLGGTDFHEENFIVDSEWPIPIDLESIASAALTFTMKQSVNIPSYLKPTFFSVASTSSLPRWMTSDNHETETRAIGGIGGRKGDIIFPIQRAIWNNIETDQMNISYKHVFCKPALPLPTLDGKAIELRPHLDLVLDGFTDTYRTIMRHKDYLTSEGLAYFKDLPTRILIRNTEEYNYLLFWSTAPDQLRSGNDYDIGLEIICGTSIDDSLRKDSFAFGDAEKQALWRRDIPYFIGSTSKCFFSSSSGLNFDPVNQYTGYENILQRIKQANENDMEWQLQLIRGFFEMSWVPAGSPLSIHVNDQKVPTEKHKSSSMVSRIEAHLHSMGETIEKLTVKHPDGLGWLSMQQGSSGILSYIFYPPPWNISGASGTAVFLANLSAYTKNPKLHNLALEAATSSANRSLNYINAHFENNCLHRHGLMGLASVLYALVVCGERLENESCLKIGDELANSLTIEDWGTVENPDILSGSSSSLLALIALYKSRPTNFLLDRIKAIGRGILSYQEHDGENLGGFRVPLASHPLLGMAHGASGIAYALSSLYLLTKDSLLPTAIQRALTYERSHYNHEAQDWPNLQHKYNSQDFMTGWCSGAPGIGLALLGILARMDDKHLQDTLVLEIEAACQATLRHLGTGLHHLCCGEAGRIIFLVTASQQLNRPDLYHAAIQATANMLDFYETKGFWKLQSMSSRSIIPGLTDGISGVGLSLLTVIDPKNTSRFLTIE